MMFSGKIDIEVISADLTDFTIGKKPEFRKQIDGQCTERADNLPSIYKKIEGKALIPFQTFIPIHEQIHYLWEVIIRKKKKL